MDIYSKAIFTVIAFALCILAIENVGSRARANDNIQRIAICSANGVRCADVDAASGSLRVRTR